MGLSSGRRTATGYCDGFEFWTMDSNRILRWVQVLDDGQQQDTAMGSSSGQWTATGYCEGFKFWTMDSKTLLVVTQM